jgi:hypothetical protein
MFALVGSVSRQCSHGIVYAHMDIQITVQDQCAESAVAKNVVFGTCP